MIRLGCMYILVSKVKWQLQKEENRMLDITKRAQEQIARYFADRKIRPVRVFLTNGCGGTRIGLALDDPKPGDAVFEVAGIRYLVDRTFLSQAQPIEVDFTGNGFKIDSALELSGGCSGCGSEDGCCS